MYRKKNFLNEGKTQGGKFAPRTKWTGFGVYALGQVNFFSYDNLKCGMDRILTTGCIVEDFVRWFSVRHSISLRLDLMKNNLLEKNKLGITMVKILMNLLDAGK